MSVVPMPRGSRWTADPRGGGRGVRVTAHPEGGLLVLSVWRQDECVATTHLRPQQAAELVAALTAGLADLAAAPAVG